MPGNAHKTIIPVYADAILFLLDEKCFLIELGCQKVHFISRKGKLHKMFPRIRLRHMDFLKYSGEFKETDVSTLYSPSRRTSGFSGRPCPEITGDYTGY